MRDSKILELKKQILENKVEFLDIICDIMENTNILLSDNYGELSEKEVNAIGWLEPFMHLLYRGSKHSVGSKCENGFTRVVIHKDKVFKFKYNSEPEIFVSIEKLNNSEGIKPIVTLELLSERLSEAEEVKSELAPIIEKYLKAGLTFEEITRMFVEIMKENRINL